MHATNDMQAPVSARKVKGLCDSDVSIVKAVEPPPLPSPTAKPSSRRGLRGWVAIAAVFACLSIYGVSIMVKWGANRQSGLVSSGKDSAEAGDGQSHPGDEVLVVDAPLTVIPAQIYREPLAVDGGRQTLAGELLGDVGC